MLCEARTVFLIGLFALLFVSPGCGVPPCFEGPLHVELIELEENTCLFEEWLGGTEFTVRASGNQEKKDCTIQATNYVDVPDGAEARGTYSFVSFDGGSAVAHLETLEFEFADCSLSTGGSLKVNERYEDVQAALSGQRGGDEEAFFVTFIYRGDCGNLIPEATQDSQQLCSNTYRAQVSRP